MPHKYHGTLLLLFFCICSLSTVSVAQVPVAQVPVAQVPVAQITEAASLTDSKHESINIPLILDNFEIEQIEILINETDPENILISKKSFLDSIQAEINSEKTTELNLKWSRSENKNHLKIEEINKTGISATFNLAELHLTITIPSQWRNQNSISQNRLKNNRAESIPVIEALPWSGFINLRAAQSWNKTQNTEGSWLRKPFYGQSDWINAYKNIRLVNQFELIEGSVHKNFQRMESYFLLDDLDKQVRWTFGDTRIKSRGFQSSQSLGGISFGREWDYRSWKTYRNTSNQEILIESTSQVEVYVNGIMRDRFTAPTGPLIVKDIPLTYGFNNIEIRIRDSFGHLRIENYSELFDSSLLRKNASDFNITAGIHSTRTTGSRSYDESKQIISTYYRRGINHSLESGANFQASRYGLMIGAENKFLNSLGLWVADIASSHRNHQTELDRKWGLAARFRWNSAQMLPTWSDNWKPQLSSEFERRGSNFSNILISNFFEPIYVWRNSNTLALHHSSSLSLAQSVQFYRARDQTDGLSLSTQLRKNFRKGWSIALSADSSRIQNNATSHNIGFSVLWHEPVNNIYIESRFQTLNERIRIEARKDPFNAINSFTLRAATETSNTDSTVDLSTNYRSNFGSAGLRWHQQNSPSQQQNLYSNMASSIAYTSKGFALGNTIQEAFAIIRSHGLSAKERLLINPSSMGSGIGSTIGSEAFATKHWPALISDLSPSSEKLVRLEVDTENFHEIKIDPDVLVLKPTYLSGTDVNVRISHRFAIEAKLLNQNNLAQSKKAGRLNWHNKIYDFFTNDAGEFFIEIEDSAPGILLLEIENGRGRYLRYSENIDFKHSQYGVLQLGELKSSQISQQPISSETP